MRIGNRARISGPLIDRIDLAIDVPALPPADIASNDGEARGEPSAAVRARVIVARERQIARQGTLNARLAVGELARAVCVDPAAQSLAQRAMARFGLSARGYHRMLKVARTIADLAGDDIVGPKAMGEAIGYRRFDDAPAPARTAPEAARRGAADAIR